MALSQAPAPNAGGRRLGLIVGGILVVAVVTAAIVSSLRPVQQLDPDSPEGVVQSFLIAIDEEQFESAHRLLSSGARADCSASDLAIEQPAMSRVVVDDVTEFDGETLVRLEATVMDVDPINPSSYETTFEFTLIDEGGALKIDRLSYPYFCGFN